MCLWLAFLSLSDLSCEDSPELLPPPGVSDNRQCVLCLKYGDDNINVSKRCAKQSLLVVVQLLIVFPVTEIYLCVF